MGAPRRSRFQRRSTTWRSPARRATGAGPHGTARFHVPGDESLTLRRLAGPTGIRRTLGDWLGTSRDGRHRRVACGVISGAPPLPLPRGTGVTRILSARRWRTAHSARRTHLVVVVVAFGDAARAAPERGSLGTEDCVARESGAGRAAERRPLRASRVRAAWRWARPPRPAAADRVRGRCLLAARSRHGPVRHARPVLVSFDVGAQRAALGRGIPTAGHGQLRVLRRSG